MKLRHNMLDRLVRKKHPTDFHQWDVCCVCLSQYKWTEFVMIECTMKSGNTQVDHNIRPVSPASSSGSST